MFILISTIDTNSAVRSRAYLRDEIFFHGADVLRRGRKVKRESKN
jgi:hypothetical protein